MLLRTTSLRYFGNSVYPALPVSFGGDTQSRRSLLSGVYARGSKRSHQSALECVTVVDSTTHSKQTPQLQRGSWGVCSRGSKISHQSALECVTVVDSTTHSKQTPQLQSSIMRLKTLPCTCIGRRKKTTRETSQAVERRPGQILERHDMAEYSTRQGHLETAC